MINSIPFGSKQDRHRWWSIEAFRDQFRLICVSTTFWAMLYPYMVYGIPYTLMHSIKHSHNDIMCVAVNRPKIDITNIVKNIYISTYLLMAYRYTRIGVYGTRMLVASCPFRNQEIFHVAYNICYMCTFYVCTM